MQSYPVEDHVDPGNGDRRINDDALTGLLVRANNHLATLILIGNQGSDVGLDTTSSKTDNDDRSNEPAKTSASLKSRRNGCQGEDKKTDHVDAAEDNNSVVLSHVLIGDDGTENGGNIAPELEESGKTSSSLVSHAESTTSLTAIKRTLDVVLEDTGGTIVGETLAKFDNSDQEGRLGQRLANLAQGQKFFCGRPDTTKTIVDFNITNRGTGADGQRLLCEVLFIYTSTSDIVVIQRQAVQVWVVISLSLLTL